MEKAPTQAVLDVEGVGYGLATSYYGSGANLSDVVTTGGAGQGGVTVNDGSIVATALSISGISTVGTGITMYASAGIASATAFYGGTFHGDGSNLTGTASTDHIITGTAATFNNAVNFNYPISINNGVSLSGVTTGLNVSGVVP